MVYIQTDAHTGRSFYRWEGPEGVSFASSTSENTSFTMPEKNVTIKAVMKWNVTFNMHDHGSVTPNPQPVKPGGRVTEPKKPTAAGYRFDGWYEDEAYTTPFKFTQKVIDRDTVVHAKWTKVWVVTTTTAHGQIPGTTKKEKTEIVVDGSKVTKPDAMTWIGYKWGGWYSGSKEFDYSK